MRLTSSSGALGLPHAQFERDPLKDMRALYGGTIHRDRDPLDNQPQRHLRSPDGQVHAFTEGRRPTETVVGISGLEIPGNAARWTALQAYRAKGGVALDHLSTEVPGLRGHQEWSTRRLKALREADKQREAAFNERSEALIQDMSLPEDEYNRRMDALYEEDAAERQQQSDRSDDLDFFAATSPGSGNDPAARFFAGITDNMTRMANTVTDAETAIARGDNIGLEMAARDFADATRAGNALSTNPLPEVPDTHTVFYAKGADLPTAARVMADNYGQLFFHSDDPELAVAGALGVPNLGELDQLWDRAMAQPTPLAAGQLVLGSLVR